MSRIHLVAGFLERDGRILLAASRYPNLPAPLWNLPGGRQRHGELFPHALQREFREEASLDIAVGGLRYVAESYDRATGTHVSTLVFDVAADGEPRLDPADAHVVALAWVAPGELAERLRVDVVREPLLMHLADPSKRYFGFADAGITIVFADSP